MSHALAPCAVTLIAERPAATTSYYDVLQSAHDDLTACFDAAGYSFFGITLNTMGFGQHCTVSVAPLAAGAKGPKGAETLTDLTANVRTWIAANPIFNAASFGSL